MPPVRTAHCGDFGSMAGRRQPVIYCGPNPAALHRRLIGAVVAGDQQDDPLASSYRLLEAAVDRRPGRIEIHAVEVEYPVGFDCPAAHPLVPAAVEGSLMDWNRLQARLRRDLCGWADSRSLRSGFGRLCRWTWNRFVARQRPDRRGNPGPGFGFLRAEGAHGRRHLSERGSGPPPKLTCHRQSPQRRPRRPNKYRSGWGP
jgi:hypothetical protein